VTDETDSLACQLLPPLPDNTLGLEHRSLIGFTAQSILANLAVAAHHAMTGDEDRDRIIAERRPDCAYRLGIPNLAGDPGIGPYLSSRDLQGFLQHRALKLGETAQIKADLCSPFTSQLFAELTGQRVWRFAGRKGPAAKLPSELLFEGLRRFCPL